MNQVMPVPRFARFAFDLTKGVIPDFFRLDAPVDYREVRLGVSGSRFQAAGSAETVSRVWLSE